MCCVCKNTNNLREKHSFTLSFFPFPLLQTICKLGFLGFLAVKRNFAGLKTIINLI